MPCKHLLLHNSYSILGIHTARTGKTHKHAFRLFTTLPPTHVHNSSIVTFKKQCACTGTQWKSVKKIKTQCINRLQRGADAPDSIEAATHALKLQIHINPCNSTATVSVSLTWTLSLCLFLLPTPSDACTHFNSDCWSCRCVGESASFAKEKKMSVCN